MFGRKGVPESRLALLRQVPLFHGLDDKLIARVDTLMVEATLSPGHELTTQGKPPDQAFVIIDGSAEVRVNGEVVREAVAGELIGELGVLDHTARTATVTATTPMRVLVMSPREVYSLLDKHGLAERVQANVDRHRSGPQP